MARRVHHFSWIALLEALIFITILGGYTFLMVWNIVKIATAADLEVVKLVLTIVGFSVGWILICVFFPFLFWIGPILIGRKAAKAEDPKTIPSDVRSRLIHRVGEYVVIENDVEVDEFLIEANSKIMIVGLGSNYYEVMHKNKRITIPSSVIDKSL